MLLRGGGKSEGSKVDLKGVTDKSVDSGILHGAALISFAEAVLERDDAALGSARDRVLQNLGPAGLSDTAAIVATFQQMVRIADGTGIPLDAPVADMTVDLRSEIGLNEFGSARNTLRGD